LSQAFKSQEITKFWLVALAAISGKERLKVWD